MKDGCRKLVLTDLVTETLDETVELVKSINPQVSVEVRAGNIASEEFVEDLISFAIERFGRLDYAVNNAGIAGKAGATHELDFQDYRKVLSVNTDAVWMCQRAELRAMVKQVPKDGYLLHLPFLTLRVRGAIVNTASTCGILGLPMYSPYITSKHAVIGITKSDALLYATDGIRVNCVLPGYAFVII